MTRRSRSAMQVMFLGALAIGVAAASGPTVGAPLVSARAIAPQGTAVVQVSSFIANGTSGTAAPIGSVDVLQVDERGNVLANLGTLNDNGVSGDSYAGDHIFGGNITIDEVTKCRASRRWRHCQRCHWLRSWCHCHPHTGTVRLQVSARFSGLTAPVRSEVTPLEVIPSNVQIGPRHFPTTQIVADASGRRMACDQVLVFAKPGTDYSHISRAVSDVGGTIVSFLPGTQVHIWQAQVACTNAQGILDAAAKLRTYRHLTGAEPNYVVTGAGVLPNDPGFVPCQPGTNLQNGITCLAGSNAPELMKVRADVAWAITTGLSSASSLNPGAYPGPIIGVIDSGVDYTQEDLSSTGKVIKGKNFVSSTADPMDDDGHGTGVAGIAAADGNNGIGVAGVSWGSRIVAEKVLDQYGKGFQLDVAAGIGHSLTLGTKIINLSLGDGLGSQPSEIYASAIDQANRAGVLVVAGAGNDYCSQREYPAGFDHTTTINGVTFNTTLISVGGTDMTDAVYGSGTQCTAGGGSNFGTWVDVYAPFFAYTTQAHQCTLQSCFAGETDFFGEGTSFSAPYVSGAAALVWAANPSMSSTDVMNTLIASADPGPADPADNTTARLNVFTAVFEAAATQCGSCPQAPEVTVARSTVLSGPQAGPMVAVGISTRRATDLQNQSVHGVSLPLTVIRGASQASPFGWTLPAGYQIGLTYSFSTWDSYSCCSPRSNNGGYFDSFTVSTSIASYWKLGLQGPLALFFLPTQDPLSSLIPSPGQPHACEATAFPTTPPAACAFNAAVLFGGQHQGNPLQTLASSGTIQVALPGVFFFGGGRPVDNTWLNFVLDTATPPDSDNLFPSFGTFHISDITPLCINNQNPTGPLLVGVCVTP